MSQHERPQYTVDGVAVNAEQLGRVAIGFARSVMGILGLIAVAAGVALMVWPGPTLVVLGALTGAFFTLTGVVRIGLGIFMRGVPTGFQVLNVIMGLFLLFSGVVILKNLTAATGVLTVIVVVLIGISWIIEGVTTLLETGRGHGSRFGWARGGIAILAGVVVLVVPTWSAMALVIVTGVSLVLLGLAGLTQAYLLGKAVPKGPVTLDQ
ncbi:HdeD family acid-resistance protein [Demequina sp.]|uniref:HdeD family acid-resistance protein n=1 Tax=Demequina sp. TaxID=2050685 RepID=UPI003A87BE7C